MKLSIVDKKNKKVGEITVKDEVFGVEVNPVLITQYVNVYLSNQRESNAHTKDRSEVRGGGKKPWRQKGTGRARFGSSRNPIWKGGGVAFGPRSTRNFKKSLTKKFRKVAMKHALSAVSKDKKVLVIDKIDVKSDKPLTKQLIDISSAFDAKKITFVLEKYDETVLKASRNLRNVLVKNSSDLNTYDIITGGHIIFEKSAIESIQDKIET